MEKINSITKTMKGKLIIASFCALLPICLIVVLELPATSKLIEEYFKIENEPVFFRYMILVGLELFILWKLQVYIRYFSSQNFKENYVIGKTDERHDLINMKTNRITIRIIIYMLCGGAIVASFFNVRLFMVISIILLVALISYIGTYIYFSKKY